MDGPADTRSEKRKHPESQLSSSPRALKFSKRALKLPSHIDFASALHTSLGDASDAVTTARTFHVLVFLDNEECGRKVVCRNCTSVEDLLERVTSGLGLGDKDYAPLFYDEDFEEFVHLDSLVCNGGVKFVLANLYTC
jgi:hypothetical protein